MYMFTSFCLLSISVTVSLWQTHLGKISLVENSVTRWGPQRLKMCLTSPLRRFKVYLKNPLRYKVFLTCLLKRLKVWINCPVRRLKLCLNSSLRLNVCLISPLQRLKVGLTSPFRRLKVCSTCVTQSNQPPLHLGGGCGLEQLACASLWATGK